MNKMLSFWILLSIFITHPALAEISEVIPETKTKVIVRHHPKTGIAYATIVAEGVPTPDPLENLKVKQNVSRPDYRMLDPKIKSGEIPYDGPARDNKKIYLFAASIATLGAAGGSVGLLAPAATTGAAGGAGLYAAGAVAVTAGTAATSYFATRPDPHQDDYTHHSESKTIYSVNGTTQNQIQKENQNK